MSRPAVVSVYSFLTASRLHCLLQEPCGHAETVGGFPYTFPSSGTGYIHPCNNHLPEGSRIPPLLSAALSGSAPHTG